MPLTVKDIDRGYAELMRRLKSEKLQLTVGVHGEEGGAKDGALSVLEVATIQEFGNGHVPERSFIRAWADENEADIKTSLGKIGAALVQGKLASAAIGLQRAGLLFVGEIQARISQGIPPPNAPSTIKAKGSSTPLINTGQLRSAIRSKVSKDGGEP